MSYTKRQLVNAAFAELGLPDHVFSLSPDELSQAVARLDSLMAAWNARGIRLGYPIQSNPANIDLDTDSNLPDMAYSAVITNLALQLSPSVMMPINPMTSRTASDTLTILQAHHARPRKAQYGANTPMGAGNRRRGGSTFFPSPPLVIEAGSDSDLDI